MNKKISVVSILGLVLAFPAIALDQTQVPNTLMAGLSNRAQGADGAMGLLWVQDDKQFVGDVVTRTDNRITSSNFLSVLYKGVEVTPFMNKGLYGINFSYQW